MTTASAALDLRSSPRHPPRALLQALRPPSRAILRSRYDIRLIGTSHVPTGGPVVLASNHVGIIDGPLLAVMAPRPVHALTKDEMFRGGLGHFLTRAGQIPVDRFHPDPAALRSCLTVLRSGGTVGIFPEGIRCDGTLSRFHHGAAWLGLASGAPVVPVTLVGTREPGGGADSIPPRGARLDVAFGPPWRVPYQPSPRRRGDVLAASHDLLAHMSAAQDDLLARLGRSLPGPLPAGQSDADPDTGFTQPHDQSGTP